MKKLVKTFAMLALLVLPILHTPQVQAGGDELPPPDLQMVTSENMIRRGNSLVMDLVLAQAGTTALSVANLDGREIWTGAASFAAGQNRVKFRVGDLPSGTYFLKVTTGSGSDTQTFAIR